jgi:hypothetical protein
MSVRWTTQWAFVRYTLCNTYMAMVVSNPLPLVVNTAVASSLGNLHVQGEMLKGVDRQSRKSNETPGGP